MYRRPKFIIKHESSFPISFHDTDAMGVIWHGNYIKFFELAREALFEALNFDYLRMKDLDLMFPITECSCKYRKMLSVKDKHCHIVTMLTQTDGKIVINYEVYAKGQKTLCAYGQTQQVAVNSKTTELYFEMPQELLKEIEEYKNKNE